MSNPAIITELSAWLTTDRHAEPIDSAEFNVYAKLSVNGIGVGMGFSSRPFHEMPYVTTDAELKLIARAAISGERSSPNAG